ncbi:MAG: crossover junction endodeoxyribonuclease RuvC [Bradyrhizobiaceae bacterium]|nr:crossover junction endodeoxyribonuclease RuvC [Bradyrhizobiaceae bacterium]
MIILGIDPGSVVCGFGVIKAEGSVLTPIEYGAIQVKRQTTSFPQRLTEIHNRLCAVIERTQPDACALEAVFYSKNVRSIVQLSQARGVAMLACAQHTLEPVEYTPMQVKRSVTGRGAAGKAQVSAMVRAILQIEEQPLLFDATDALAVAICHAVNNGQPPQPVAKQARKSSRKAWAEFVKSSKP